MNQDTIQYNTAANMLGSPSAFVATLANYISSENDNWPRITPIFILLLLTPLSILYIFKLIFEVFQSLGLTNLQLPFPYNMILKRKISYFKWCHNN